MFHKFIKTLLLIEDRFFTHIGVDIVSIVRAIVVNFQEGRFAQGGSTITQQLARTLYLTNKKTITRKIKETLIAFYLELTLSKKRILFIYMKNVYMGQDKKGKRISGFLEAARFYFDKSIRKLSVAEYAALVAMVKGPNIYKPSSAPGTARRIMVLGKMLDKDLITKEEFFEASKVSF